MQFLQPPPVDPDGERAQEAMEKLREQLHRGIALPPKLITTGNPPLQPIWVGIDLARQESN